MRKGKVNIIRSVVDEHSRIVWRWKRITHPPELSYNLISSISNNGVPNMNRISGSNMGYIVKHNMCNALMCSCTLCELDSWSIPIHMYTVTKVYRRNAKWPACLPLLPCASTYPNKLAWPLDSRRVWYNDTHVFNVKALSHRETMQLQTALVDSNCAEIYRANVYLAS